MMNLNSNVKELNFLDEIDRIEEEYKSNKKGLITNVSDWNPSKEFKTSVADFLANNFPVDSIDYIFSYSQSEQRKEKVLNRLGCPLNKAILFTHSGSASILNCVNMLYAFGVKKLVILCPAYFTLFHVCKIYNIECIPVNLKRDKNGFYIEADSLVKMTDKNIAFWITNPVYCTSVYYNKKMIRLFKMLLENNIVVFDESLCFSSLELSHVLSYSQNFIGIYSPHKSVCINGNKFSAIVTDEKRQKFLDAWSDVLCGCLSTGNHIAISHFLSENFSKYSEAFLQNILINKNITQELCDKYNVSYDKDSYGYLITVYFHHIASNRGLDINFIKTVMEKTGIRFISGKRNHFGDNLGFCFRINLAAYNDQFRVAIERSFDYLSKY